MRGSQPDSAKEKKGKERKRNLLGFCTILLDLYVYQISAFSKQSRPPTFNGLLCDYFRSVRVSGSFAVVLPRQNTKQARPPTLEITAKIILVQVTTLAKSVNHIDCRNIKKRSTVETVQTITTTSHLVYSLYEMTCHCMQASTRDSFILISSQKLS